MEPGTQWVEHTLIRVWSISSELTPSRFDTVLVYLGTQKLISEVSTVDREAWWKNSKVLDDFKKIEDWFVEFLPVSYYALSEGELKSVTNFVLFCKHSDLYAITHIAYEGI